MIRTTSGAILFLVFLVLLVRLRGLLARDNVLVAVVHTFIPNVVDVALEGLLLGLIARDFHYHGIHRIEFVLIVPRNGDGLLVGIENDARIDTSLRFGDFIIPTPCKLSSVFGEYTQIMSLCGEYTRIYCETSQIGIVSRCFSSFYIVFNAFRRVLCA